MANYFYVKSGGGLDEDDDTTFTEEQADSFANIGVANYYDSIAAAASDGTKSSPAIDGDFILVSSAHNKSFDYGKGPTFNLSGTTGGAGLQIISVNDSDSSVYLPGAIEKLTDGIDDLSLYKHTFFAGLTLGTADNSLVPMLNNTSFMVMDSTIDVPGNGDIAIYSSLKDGCSFELKNVDINCGDAASLILRIDAGSEFIWRGGALTGVDISAFFNGIVGGGGGARIELIGVDISTFTGTLLPSTTAGTTDVILMRLVNCTLSDSLTALHGTLATRYHRFELFNTDDSSDKFYRFYVADGAGTAKNNDAIYVTAGEAWYGGSDHSSIQVDTTTLCNHAQPFVFELPAQYIDLSSGTTDTLTLDIVTEETLAKHDMAAFLVYPDGTTAVQPNWVSSGPFATGYYGIDPMDSSTAMPTSALDTSDWTESLTGENYYEMVLDTSSDVGQATAVSVRIEVYKASIGPIYIHPLITVSAA